MATHIERNLPKKEDGCVIMSFRCKGPSREDMKLFGEDGDYHRNKCKRCDTCGMVFCEYHMGHGDHFSHCHARLNMEKDAYKVNQKKLIKEAEDKHKEQDKKIEFEKAKKEAIKNGNNKLRSL